MPIKAYTGLPRNGKSYEVCSVVIYESIKLGRRVLSNIAGLNQDEFYKLILKENPKLKESDLGKIVPVTADQILKPEFWLTEDTAKSDREEWQLQAGDLLALDEIWRFWDGFKPSVDLGEGKVTRPQQVLHFFRMHGHFTHKETGLTCEIALISQDVNDFHRQIKGVIEQTFVMTKHTDLGMNNRYIVQVYRKAHVHKKPITDYQKAYQDKYFPLYKSHSHNQEGDAKPLEESADKRGNVFNRPIFYIIPVMLIFAGWGLVKVLTYFNPESHKKEGSQVLEDTNPKFQTANSPIQPQPIQPQPIDIEPTYQLIGTYYQQGQKVFLVKTEEGTYRHLHYVLETNHGLIDKTITFNGIDINSWERVNNDQKSFFNPAAPVN